MKKKIFLAMGSPRKKGNTELIAEAFMNGAQEAGHKVTKIDIAKLKIKGCRDCRYCFKHDNKCKLDDDMQEVYPVFDSCDVVVFAVPLYYFNFPAQVKAMIDRLYPRYRTGYSCGEAVLLAVAGEDDVKVFDALVATYKKIIDSMDAKDAGIVLAPGVSDIGDIKNHPALQQAFELGKSI